MKNVPWNKEPAFDRFMRYALPEPNSGCWLWTSSTYHGGYGRLFADGKVQKAHRLSWQFFQGEIPKGKFVCHKCDNPPCVNPEHLFLGEAADNNHDMMRKGRAVFLKGSRHGGSKLTEADVIKIRADTRIDKLIAPEYGVHRGTINYIKRRKWWKFAIALSAFTTAGPVKELFHIFMM